jgi:hypothetical protein
MEEKEERRVGPGIDLENGTISYDYIKGNNFRVIHVDGVYGGTAPRPGIIHMDVFNERWPIPKRTVNKFSREEGVGKEIFEERITRDAVVREVEVELVMGIDTAIRMRDWLNNKITKCAEIKEKQTKLLEGKQEG